MLEVYNDATNKIEADRAAEAEFQNAFLRRVPHRPLLGMNYTTYKRAPYQMEEGAKKAAGRVSPTLMAPPLSKSSDALLGFLPVMGPGYHIPTPPPPPPPLVIKRGRIKKMKRVKHKKSSKDTPDSTKDVEYEPENGGVQKDNPADRHYEGDEVLEIKKEDSHEIEPRAMKLKINTVEFVSPRGKPTEGTSGPSPRPIIPTLALGSASKSKDEGMTQAQSRFSRRQGFIVIYPLYELSDTDVLFSGTDETPRTPTSSHGSFGKELGRSISFYITSSSQLTKLAFNLGETVRFIIQYWT